MTLARRPGATQTVVAARHTNGAETVHAIIRASSAERRRWGVVGNRGRTELDTIHTTCIALRVLVKWRSEPYVERLQRKYYDTG